MRNRHGCLVDRKWMMLLIFCALALGARGEWKWTIGELDDSGQACGLGTSVALDQDGHTHIAYQHVGSLAYMANASGVWTRQIIRPCQGYISLALDSQGHAHIAYYYGGDLQYITNASDEWDRETVDAEGNTGGYASLALDANGAAHICYYNDTLDDLMYATNASGSWTRETVDPGGETGVYWFEAGRHCSLALDSSGHAHISYGGVAVHKSTSEEQSKLHYATNASGVWVTASVDNDGDVGEYTDIAIDSAGAIHISYYDIGEGRLKYATNASGSWAAEVVDEDGTVGGYASIAVDSNDAAHISYYRYTMAASTWQDLRHATNRSGSWVIHKFAYPDNDGRYTSIALDDNDYAHITFCASNNRLRYFVQDGLNSWPTAKTLDGKDIDEGMGQFTSIDFGPDGSPHVACKTEYYLRYYTFPGLIPRKWYLSDTGNKGSYCGLAVDSTGAAHIVYKDAMNQDVMHAEDASGTWAHAALAGEGYCIAMDVDENDALHVVYTRDNGWRYLAYGTNASGTWTVADIMRAEWYDVGGAAIKADQAGYAHVAIMNPTGDLIYLTNETGAWANETVEALGGSLANPDAYKKYVGLALDSSGNPRIAYYDKPNQRLKYATKPGDSWIAQVVDSDDNPGSHLALTLDDSDEPWIAYYAAGEGDLRVAFQQAGQWETETLDSKDDVGAFTSIGIDPMGVVHIPYFDVTDQSLKYAVGVNELGVGEHWRRYR